MATNELSTLQVKVRLEKTLDAIWRMGDEDECSEKHIRHSLAAIISGKTWRDGVDYSDPAGAGVFYCEWPEAGPFSFTSTPEELLCLTNYQEDNAAYRARLEQLLADPKYVADGRRLIEEWKQRLESHWAKVQALHDLVGETKFREAALASKYAEYGSLVGCLEDYWSKELSGGYLPGILAHLKRSQLVSLLLKLRDLSYYVPDEWLNEDNEVKRSVTAKALRECIGNQDLGDLEPSDLFDAKTYAQLKSASA